MKEPGMEQIRAFRLHSHHLDAIYQRRDIISAAGACGLQNTPPGAWETALFIRIPDCSLAEMDQMLYKEKSLVQAWSIRGLPVVFPADESRTFLSALIAGEDEQWIYTAGITAALDFLGMGFDELLELLKQVMPRLDNEVVVSKTVLDQTLADWMLPLLPAEKRGLWNAPSMYGSPDKQTVGGAVVSFMLRPCAFCGLVVFSGRSKTSPSFTSYRNWTGRPLNADEGAPGNLVRKYLHCYGPATLDGFVNWLGCTGKQGRRMWASVAEEMEEVRTGGKKAFILSEDHGKLYSVPGFDRELILLGGHDPYLDQRDRAVLQPDRTLQKQIWRLVSNPGVVLYRGEAVGIWNSRKKSNGMEIRLTLWNEIRKRRRICDLAEEYAAFRGLRLMKLEGIEG